MHAPRAAGRPRTAAAFAPPTHGGVLPAARSAASRHHHRRRTSTAIHAVEPDTLTAASSTSATAAAAAAAAAALSSGPLDAVSSIVSGGLGKADITLVASAVLACFSVGLNLYGGLLTERKRADLQLEVERERALAAAAAELQSLLAKYRGPLLESAIDLEQRLWHLACFPQEWALSPRAAAACDALPALAGPPVPGCVEEDGLCGDEINYAVFCLAQFLGFVEVVRREGPRERSFLQRDNGGSDVLATFVEGIRFVMCASDEALAFWGATPDAEREHPGARLRRRRRIHEDKGNGYVEPVDGDGDRFGGGNGASTTNGAARGPLRPFDDFDDEAYTLRVSRGAQRAIGSYMITTPMGAERHYTLSYGEFCARLASDPAFAARLAPLRADVAALAAGPRWGGSAPFPVSRWTRLLLLQQLLVEAMELLDPEGARVPLGRRQPLSACAFSPLVEHSASANYSKKLNTLEGALPAGVDPLAGLKSAAGGGLALLQSVGQK